MKKKHSKCVFKKADFYSSVHLQCFDIGQNITLSVQIVNIWISQRDMILPHRKGELIWLWNVCRSFSVCINIPIAAVCCSFCTSTLSPWSVALCVCSLLCAVFYLVTLIYWFTHLITFDVQGEILLRPVSVWGSECRNTLCTLYSRHTSLGRETHTHNVLSLLNLNITTLLSIRFSFLFISSS